MYHSTDHVERNNILCLKKREGYSICYTSYIVEDKVYNSSYTDNVHRVSPSLLSMQIHLGKRYICLRSLYFWFALMCLGKEQKSFAQSKLSSAPSSFLEMYCGGHSLTVVDTAKGI